jgi:molybdopterin-guanine dinucleotide biosynthesis protein A
MTGDHPHDRAHVRARGDVLIRREEITGVVLCGGRGRRMGGADKPLLSLNRRPMVAHVLERLLPQVGRVIISANRELATYRAFGHVVVPDATPDVGPLGGLATVTPLVSTPWIFCCAGDAPLLPRDLIAQMAARVPDDATVVYPISGAQPHYLFLLARPSLCATIIAYLARHERSVRGWLSTLPSHAVPLDHLEAGFRSVNIPEELTTMHTLAEGVA